MRLDIAVAAISLALIVAGCGGANRSATDPGLTPPGSPAAPSATPMPSDPPTPIGSPAASSPAATPDPFRDELPTRVAVPDLGIDLPVVSGDLVAAGNPPDYPLCDVAQYLTTYRYPGRPGTTTWIYGHAREGMLLALLEASEVKDGASLIGASVQVWTDGNRRHTYRITEVNRHATDRSSARGVPPDGNRLVLQTSEGPKGTVPKLQVVAERTEVADATPAQSTPDADPRVCYEP